MLNGFVIGADLLLAGLQVLRYAHAFASVDSQLLIAVFGEWFCADFHIGSR